MRVWLKLRTGILIAEYVYCAIKHAEGVITMDKDKAHELTRDIMVAIITSDKPVARQGDYIAGVCNAYKMIFDTIIGVDEYQPIER